MVPLSGMLMLALDGEGPLNRQVYVALRAAILEGRLAPGARLGSSRGLARDLGVSRNTVLHAYEQLVAEGYAGAREGSGTFVCDTLPGTAAGVRHVPRGTGRGVALSEPGLAEPGLAEPGLAEPVLSEPVLSDMGRRIREQTGARRATWSLRRDALRYDFRYGEPDYDDLPLETWSRVLGRRARRLSVRRLSYQPPGGAPELREALAGYLARARGVICDPEQLMIVQGSQQAIDLSVRLLVDAGDPAVIEEPHYTGFSFCLRAAGAKLVPIPVDEDGMRVDQLDQVAAARLVCVTPSHQFPTGGVLPLPRRLELLEWARQRDATILEDDYDGEFRYPGRPIECLQSLDRDGRVLYVGTASKVLFPALRIGWIVMPPALVDVFHAAKAIADTGTATLEQLAFADFVSEGHLERHVRRVRKRHAARRQALIEAVECELGDRAQVVGTRAGIHALLRIESLPASFVPRLRSACRERDVGVYPAAPFYETPPPHAELLLGYASLCEEDIRSGIRRLAEALDRLA